MTTTTLSLTEATRLNLKLDTSPGLPKLPHIPSKINDCGDALTLEQQEANLFHVARWIVERDLGNFDMGNWHNAWNNWPYPAGHPPVGKEAFYECGTTHCIAGFAQVMAGEVGFSEFPSTAGYYLLGAEAKSHFQDSNEEGLEFLKEVIARNS
jgi:hypothetical protein